MGDKTTFRNKVRATGGFEVITISGGGVETVNMVLDTGSGLITPGSGLTSATGFLHKSSVTKMGDLIHTQILMDITGLDVNATGDIIGDTGAANSHFGQITAAVNGTVFAGRVTCLEAPTGGDADIDLYAADEATGTEDDPITGLTETALVDAGAHTLGSVDVMDDFPTANQYLYLVAGAGASTFDVYTAGKLLVEFWGYDA